MQNVVEYVGDFLSRVKSKRSCVVLLLACLALGACTEVKPEPQPMTEALNEAFAQPSLLDRIERLSAALQRLDAQNLDASVRVFEREHWWIREAEIGLFFEAWSRFDPEAALDYAMHWPSRERRGAAMMAALQAWALRDPKTAAAKFDEIAPSFPQIRGDLRRSLLTGYVESRRPGVLEYVAGSNPASWAFSAMVVVGTQTRLMGASGVVRWADAAIEGGEYPEDLIKDVFRRTTGLAARLDPEVVVPFVEKHWGRDYAGEGPRLLVERWVAHDADSAMAWLHGYATEEEQQSILRSAFTKWLIGSRSEAAAWIEAAPDAPQLDPAYVGYAYTIAQRDPGAAIPWAERVHDESLRREALERVGGELYRREPLGAEVWLQGSSLDEAARERVRAAGSRKRPRRPLEGL